MRPVERDQERCLVRLIGKYEQESIKQCYPQWEFFPLGGAKAQHSSLAQVTMSRRTDDGCKKHKR
ncbi:hypothetical protein EMIT0111MI5_280044 [Burkholderia sp. IT-111MI5]